MLADDRGWGPAAKSRRRWSRLKSTSEHWAQMLAVGIWVVNTERRWTRMIAIEVPQRILSAKLIEVGRGEEEEEEEEDMNSHKI